MRGVNKTGFLLPEFAGCIYPRLAESFDNTSCRCASRPTEPHTWQADSPGAPASWAAVENGVALANAGSTLLCTWQRRILWAHRGCSRQLACTSALVLKCRHGAATHPAAAEAVWVCAAAPFAGFIFIFTVTAFTWRSQTLLLAKPLYYSIALQ